MRPDGWTSCPVRVRAGEIRGKDVLGITNKRVAKPAILGTILPKHARLTGMLCDPRLRKEALLALIDLAGNSFTLLCKSEMLNGARE